MANLKKQIEHIRGLLARRNPPLNYVARLIDGLSGNPDCVVPIAVEAAAVTTLIHSDTPDLAAIGKAMAVLEAKALNPAARSRPVPAEQSVASTTEGVATR